MFLYKNLFFFNIFCYFNPNHAYWNQRRLFSGNLPGMFAVFQLVAVEGAENNCFVDLMWKAAFIFFWFSACFYWFGLILTSPG